jgi:acyl dehydratase
VTGPLTGNDFAAPIGDRYLEDYVAGEAYTYGRVTIDEASIIAFARQYDPQPFHIDPLAAAGSIYGGLIASGWQTVAVMMRMLVDHVISPASSLGSPGCDDLRWLLPVRPGDSLAVRIEILSARHSRSKPDRGLVGCRLEIANQRDEVVMTLQTVLLVRARQPARPSGSP